MDRRGCIGLTLAIALLVGMGCAPRPAAEPSVGKAWQRRQGLLQQPHSSNRPPDARSSGDERADRPVCDPIATLDDRPIARHRVVGLLLRSHGVGVLEQIIVLEAAERLAGKRGLTVTDADIEREYERALRRLIDPLSSVNSGSYDRQAAVRALDSVLSNRNISREEFLAGMRRRAYLRRIANAELVPTDEQFREEFERRFGRRVRLRHIQVATLRQAAEVRERLDAGDDFAEIARRYSVNSASAPRGGLLDPFSIADEDVPEAFRRAAFAIEPGDVSDAVRVGEWYHFLNLEEEIPADPTDFDRVRGDLEISLRERLVEPAMQELHEHLFRQAKIDIHDPLLREVFEKVHPDR